MSKSLLTIAKIALPVPCNQLFDYLWPDNTAVLPEAGLRVKVFLGFSIRTGVVLAVENTTNPRKNLKTITEVLDEKPILAAPMLEFLKWASQYYQSPIGEVIQHGLPTLLRKHNTQQDLSELPTWLKLVPKKIPKKPSKAAFKLITLLQEMPKGCHLNNFKHYDIQFRTLKPAIKQGWLIKAEQPLSNNQEIKLNDEQNDTYQKIIKNKEFSVHYIEGITGSGKTYIYAALALHYIKQKKQVLLIVPEISLTSTIIKKLQKICGPNFIAMHSKLTPKDRLISWQQVQSGWVDWVVGTRSALFLPWRNLGCIIIDEAHDLSLKQQTSWRYSARDCAIMMAKFWHMPVILGSATPSLESFYNIQNKRYHHYHLKSRYAKASLPTIKIVDMRNCQEIINPKICQKIQETIEKKQQVLIFINRRGFALVLFCKNCQWVSMCDNCDAKMIKHQNPSRLICHQCSLVKKVPLNCPECKQDTITDLGYGSQKVASWLEERFKARILRVDRDSVKFKNLDEVLASINDDQHDILVGTQMLAKGHHWPKMTLVVIVNADNSLYSPDFRSMERFAQLFVQVAGRAGRAELPGTVYLQTNWPNHPAFSALISQGYRNYALDLLKERKEALLPPYTSMVCFLASCHDKQAIMQFLNKISAYITASAKNHQLNLIGPMPAFITQIDKQHRMSLIVMTKKRNVLQQILAATMPLIAKAKPSKIKLVVDIDPAQMP